MNEHSTIATTDENEFFFFSFFLCSSVNDLCVCMGVPCFQGWVGVTCEWMGWDGTGRGQVGARAGAGAGAGGVMRGALLAQYYYHGWKYRV